MIVYKHKWVFRQLEDGKVVFDMGCNGDDGNAFLHKYLENNLPNAKIIGVDIVDGADVDIVYDLNKRFPKGWKADYVVAGSILGYLLEPHHFLQECHRILMDGGRLIINSISTYQQLNRKSDRHYFVWTMEMLCNLIETAGFKIVKREYGLYYYRVTAKNVLFAVLDWITCFTFPFLSPHLYIVAEVTEEKPIKHRN